MAALTRDGFLFLPGFLPGVAVFDAASRIGAVVDMKKLQQNCATVQDLRPVERSSALKNTYSGNFGISRFPLHTDFAHWAVPPRYFLLRCVSGTAVTGTSLLFWSELLSAIPRQTLEKAVFRGRGKRAGRSSLRRALQMYDGVDLFRWDSLFLVPMNESALELAALMQDCRWDNQATKVFLVNENDAILVDNWRVMHGRDSVPGDHIGRHLQRVYIEEMISGGSSG